MLGRFQYTFLDFQSEWVENWLELMAKGMRTQPTSRNSIPTSRNLDSVEKSTLAHISIKPISLIEPIDSIDWLTPTESIDNKSN